MNKNGKEEYVMDLNYLLKITVLTYNIYWSTKIVHTDKIRSETTMLIKYCSSWMSFLRVYYISLSLLLLNINY